MKIANYKKIWLIVIFLSSLSFSYSQNAPATGVQYEKQGGKKVWTPENTQKQMEEKKAEDEKLTKEPKTRKGKARQIKQREKHEKKDYHAHHNRIQHPDVKYRMNKNEKKAHKTNVNKRPNIFKRIAGKLNFKKRKVAR